MFYGGDSDSIGVIVVCCYGVMYEYEGVLEVNYKVLWKRKILDIFENDYFDC